ncbi:MAG: ATP-binding protein [Thermoguttaceae bacterium]|jgi:predicted ATPase with chaperone activity
MNLLTLTDAKLAAFHRQAANEIARRAKAATNGYDAASIIHGNEMVKRAVVVAAAGGHSLLLVGPPNSGKTMLRAVALDLGLGTTFEVRPCPCGYRSDPRRACQCGYKQIERHLRNLPVADINVEVCPPALREMKSPGTTLTEMRHQIDGKTAYESLELDEDSRNLLKAATAELALDADALSRIIAVARTIANLDRSERIEARHLCEAINYRAMRR